LPLQILLIQSYLAHIICYELKLLEGSNRTTLVLSNTRELNRDPLQSSLPYILLPMVCAHYCAPYPKWPCVEHEVNMCYLCCMTSLVLEPSTPFSQVSWSVLWLCHQIVTDVTMWLINPNLSCSKNRKKK